MLFSLTPCNFDVLTYVVLLLYLSTFLIVLYQQHKLYQKLDVTPGFLKKALLIAEQFYNQYMLFKMSSSSTMFHSFTYKVNFFDFLAEQHWESRRCLTTLLRISFKK